MVSELLRRFPEQRSFRIPKDTSVGEDWGRADLHIHARDASTDLNLLFQAAKLGGLSVVSVTEHDDRQNFAQVWQLGREYDIDVIAGSEITVLTPTKKPAHLLIYFPDPDCVPSPEVYESFFGWGKDATRAIDAIHEMGGLCVVPHGTSPLTFSFGEIDLRHLVDNGFKIDGTEVLNSTLAGWSAQENLMSVFGEGGLGGAVGGSDSRLPEHVGICQTRFLGKTKEDLIQALRNRQTVAEGTFLPLADSLKIGRRQAGTIFARVRESLKGGSRDGG